MLSGKYSIVHTKVIVYSFTYGIHQILYREVTSVHAYMLKNRPYSRSNPFYCTISLSGLSIQRTRGIKVSKMLIEKMACRQIKYMQPRSNLSVSTRHIILTG